MDQFKTSSATLTMLSIPGGTIELRDDRKKTSWTAEIEPFHLAAHPVTAGLYASVVGPMPAPEHEQLKPVVNVSWLDAIKFCNLLSRREGLQESYTIRSEDIETVCDWSANGYRLPTEAEWQHACRAGTLAFQYDEIDEIAWYKENSGGERHDVGRKAPNAWGLFDMLGNVWEWCWDLYDVEVYGSYRIFRGGSWAEDARGCGATCRRRSHPTFAIDDVGFRVARSRT